MPGWVGPVDLVVAVSLSGRAEGPLAVAAEAARRGCRLLTVGAAGSPLADVTARAHGVHVPTGRALLSSRSSIWALSVPVLLAAHALDLVDLTQVGIDDACEVLDDVAERSRPSSETFVNPAKTLAVDLAGSIPLVLGEGVFAGAAAVRAAAELARSARHPAVHGILPDDATTVVATFDGPFAGGLQDVFADPFDDPAASTSRLRLLLLRDVDVDPETRQVTDVVRDTATSSGVRVERAVGHGHAPARPHRRPRRHDRLRLRLPGARGRSRPRDVPARRRPQGAAPPDERLRRHQGDRRGPAGQPRHRGRRSSWRS